MEEIALRSAKVLSISIDKGGAKSIALRPEVPPRLANRLLKRVRDFAEIKYNGVIRKEVAEDALDLLDVDTLGLDTYDRLVSLESD